ncbi:hypothetical protein [Dyella silvatica]|uniref:hypothetical protein n=1 Tax=Dyella silvatica TaxID=2992128 RepID=UPI00224DFEFB|nr:hypothetical protein [Dyella silvatica]
MSSLWTDLLFLHGHISNADLARRLSEAKPAQSKPRGQRVTAAESQARPGAKSASPSCHGACAAT